MSKREPKHIGEVMSDIAERYNKLTKTKMSKEDIIKSLKDILDEINETPKDSFVDITYIKETLEDILNQNKDDE
jgi:patatin-like phospholipase/acyl hydrolase